MSCPTAARGYENQHQISNHHQVWQIAYHLACAKQTAKAGLEAVTKGLARELAPEIKVNAIAPGAMLEPPDVTWTEEQKNKVIESIPLKRMGSEKDIANAVKFLAHSEYITGQIIKVDGGRSL